MGSSITPPAMDANWVIPANEGPTGETATLLLMDGRFLDRVLKELGRL